jgi:hypothetical protein
MLLPLLLSLFLFSFSLSSFFLVLVGGGGAAVAAAAAAADHDDVAADVAIVVAVAGFWWIVVDAVSIGVTMETGKGQQDKASLQRLTLWVRKSNQAMWPATWTHQWRRCGSRAS